MERFTTRSTLVSVKGIPWEDLSTGAKITRETHVKLYRVLERLQEYENTGLTPEQIIEMDKLYAEKCRELAKCKESGWRERMMNNFLRSGRE